MTNPFDDPDGSYVVLANPEGRFSLWPEFLPVPDGWQHEYGPDARQACLDVVAERWTDDATVGVGPGEREGGQR